MVVKKFLRFDSIFFNVYNFNQIASSVQGFSKKVEKKELFRKDLFRMIQGRKFQLLSVRFHPDFMLDTCMFNPLMEKSVDRKRILKHELLGKMLYAKYVI